MVEYIYKSLVGNDKEKFYQKKITFSKEEKKYNNVLPQRNFGLKKIWS